MGPSQVNQHSVIAFQVTIVCVFVPDRGDRLLNMKASARDQSAFQEVQPVPGVDSNGVDRAQIRRQLERTPADRLRRMQSFLRSVILIRRGIRRP